MCGVEDARAHAALDEAGDEFQPGGKRLLASFASVGEGLSCWDIATGKKLWQRKEIGSRSPIELTWDGKILFPELGPQALDLAAGEMNPIKGSPPIRRDLRLALAPDGRTLLISADDGIIVWDMVQGKELRTLLGADEKVIITPDSKAVITNGGALQRWDLATGKAAWSDTSELGHIGEVALVRFSADGKRLVSASTDGTLRLWDTTTDQPLRIWRAHPNKRPMGPMPFGGAGKKTSRSRPTDDG